MATPRKLVGTALVLFLIPYNGFMLLFSPRGERHAFRGERKRYRTSPPISRRSAPERVFSASLHIMTSAAEKAPLLPHCTAFIPLEKQRRRIYKRRKSPPWAQRELPSPLGQFFLQDGAWRAIIFKLAHQAPSNLPLCEQAKALRGCALLGTHNGPRDMNAKALRGMRSLMRASADFLVESALPHYAPL